MRPGRSARLLLGLSLFAATAPSQLSDVGAQLWNADSQGLPTAGQQDAHFGRSLATGDFDGDGFADLAIGIPGQDVGGGTSAGAVLVLYSGPGGPSEIDSQLWTENDLGLGNASASNDVFGWSLATGDFDGDGYDDLAVGAPFEPVASQSGVAFVLYGGPTGLAAAGAQLWTQDSPASGLLRTRRLVRLRTRRRRLRPRRLRRPRDWRPRRGLGGPARGGRLGSGRRPVRKRGGPGRGRRPGRLAGRRRDQHDAG